MVAGWFGGALNAFMRGKEEALLSWVSDCGIHNCARRNISHFSKALTGLSSEESSVVSLLSHKERDLWLICFVQGLACTSDCLQLSKDMQKLAFADSISVVENPVWLVLEPGLFIELEQQLLGHFFHFLDHFNSSLSMTVLKSNLTVVCGGIGIS